MTVTIPLVIVMFVLAWVLRPRERLTGNGKLALLAAIVPPALIAIAAVVIQVLHNGAGNTGVSDVSNVLFIIGLCLVGAAVLILIGFAVKHRGEIARVMGLSVCIAVIVIAIEFGLLEWLGGV